MKFWTHRHDFVAEFPFDQLTESPPYQRELSKSWKRKQMDMGLDKYAYGVPTFAKLEDGSVEIVDGRRRVDLAQSLGFTSGPARVVVGLNYEERAALFRKIDHRSPLTPFDKFRAGRESREREVLEIEAILSSFTRDGRHLFVGDDKSPACVRAITMLREAYRFQPVGEALTEALRVLCWWLPHDLRIPGGLMKALANLVSTQAAVKDGRSTSYDIHRVDVNWLDRSLKAIPWPLAVNALTNQKRKEGKAVSGHGHDERFWVIVLTHVYIEGCLAPDMLEGAPDITIALNGQVKRTGGRQRTTTERRA